MKLMALPVSVALWAIDANLVPLAVLSGLVLAAVALSALSFLTVHRARALVDEAEQRSQAEQERCEATLQSLQETRSALEAELREIREQPLMAGVPASPKPGLNLTTRSQALRMHRRGDPPDRIAAALDIPLQEVDLLLKVHRIVISNL